MITKDMTEGNAMKHILFFAIPLFIGNIFQQIYNMVDTMIAGYNLGDNAIAAIGTTSTLFSLINNFALGLNNGYAIVVTQRFGAKDIKEFKKSVASMLVLNLCACLVVTGLSLAFLNPMMGFLNVPRAIYKMAYTYIFIIFAGLSSSMIYNMLAAFMRSVGNSRVPLYFLIVSCFINIGMDLLLIMVCGLGVAGAAIATVFAQMCSAVFSFIYVLKKYKPLLPEKEDFIPDKAMYKNMLTTGAAMALMICIFNIGSVILQSAVNKLEETIITAHTVARKCLEIFMQPLSTVATATSTFVSQNWGAKKAKRIRDALKRVMMIEVAWGLFAFGVMYLFGENLVTVVSGTKNRDVIDNAVMNLHINFVFIPTLGILLSLRMAMQSMGQKIPPLFSSSLELAVKVIGAIWIVPVYKYLGASFIEPVTWLLCMALLTTIYMFTYKKNFRKIEA